MDPDQSLETTLHLTDVAYRLMTTGPDDYEARTAAFGDAIQSAVTDLGQAHEVIAILVAAQTQIMIASGGSPEQAWMSYYEDLRAADN